MNQKRRTFTGSKFRSSKGPDQIDTVTSHHNLAQLSSLILLILVYLSIWTLLKEDYTEPPMAAAVQDVIMLLGDSITQGGWEPGAFAQRLARQCDLFD
jgi:hypothetical protein